MHQNAGQLQSILQYWAQKQPHQVLLYAPEPKLTITYQALLLEAMHLHAWLDNQGIDPHGHIGLFMHNGRQTTALFLATMVGGRVITPFNLLAPPEQLAYALDHSDIEILFYAPKNRDALWAALPNVKRRFPIIEINPDAAVGPYMDSEAKKLPFVNPEQGALLMYTSGTTGTPKGVLLNHSNLIHAGKSISTWHSLDNKDVVLSSLPIYHINGQCISTVTPFYTGGGIIAPHHFSVNAWWELAQQYQATWINMVPTIIAYLINAAKSTGKKPSREDLKRIRFGRSASAPLPPEQHKEFESLFGITVIEAMGMTESSSMVFCNPHDERRRYGSPGLPCGVEAKIIDPSGHELGENMVGEICLRGSNVMSAYYKGEAETQKAFGKDAWLKTGDLGMRDADGFYFITGRLKELIIKGGENIAPREIDEGILKHPAVLDAAAVGIPDANYGQEIMVCVVLKEGANCSEDELRDFSNKVLGKFRTPKVIKFLDDLPRGASGKVQRLKLLELVDS